jgi:hypothetical protein
MGLHFSSFDKKYTVTSEAKLKQGVNTWPLTLFLAIKFL